MSKAITGLTASEIFPYYGVELYFDDADDTRYNEVGYLGENVLRFWTGYYNYDLTLGGADFLPTGELLRVEIVNETSDLSAQSASLALNGIDSAIVTLALTEPYQGRLAKIFFGIVGQTPIEIFSGFMDVMGIEDSGQTSDISLTIESRLVELERSRQFRYTDQSHKNTNPFDTAVDRSTDSVFSYVASLQDKQIAWGRESE